MCFILPTFPKIEKLCKREAIQQLFAQAEAFTCYPLRLLYAPVSSLEAPYQLLISVPKRTFKRAVHRNLLKRRLRESYRLQKTLIARKNRKVMPLPFLYIGKELTDYATIYKSVTQLIEDFSSSTHTGITHSLLRSFFPL